MKFRVAGLIVGTLTAVAFSGAAVAACGGRGQPACTVKTGSSFERFAAPAKTTIGRPAQNQNLGAQIGVQQRGAGVLTSGGANVLTSGGANVRGR